MKSLIVALVLFSSSLLAADLGWRHKDFQSAEGKQFSLDIHLTSYHYSFGTAYAPEIWVHVNGTAVTEASVVVLNFFEGSQTAAEIKEFRLNYNPSSGVFEALVPNGLDITRYIYGDLRHSYQEIAIKLNGHQWIKTFNGTSNFSFNILEQFGIN